jgi:hypothetical protein
MVKSLLAQFKKEHPEAFKGDNPWLPDLHILEDQERGDWSAVVNKRQSEKQILPYLPSISMNSNLADSSPNQRDFCYLGVTDHCQMLQGLHTKQERKIKIREGKKDELGRSY